MRKLKFRPVKFPRDELKHKCAVEWWYFNGILKDKKGNKYSYMDCLMKTDNKKTKLPIFKKLPLKNLYYSHSLISDIKKKKFYPRMGYFLLVSKDSFTKSLLFINYTEVPEFFNNIIEETKKFKYHIKTEDFDLYMESGKKPLLEANKGYVDLKSRTSYYYSLSSLKTKGTIYIKGKPIKVTGKSWFDHQWANASYIKDRWTWFSIQLDNNTEIVCYEYDDGKNKSYLATILDSNNKHESTEEVILTPTKIKWKSPVTKTTYPLSWKIEIPSKKIELEVKPLLKTQEMLFGTINYWEGPTEIKGKIKNKKVKGQGFLELMGYPKKISNLKVLEHDAKKALGRFLEHFK